jgi:uncharacterized protein with HEPN domain
MCVSQRWRFNRSWPDWTRRPIRATRWVQAAVERKFEVIGEALNQLAKQDAGMASRIPDLRLIVAFRNQLIHGYATVSSGTVWTIAQDALLATVQELLDESA